MKSNNIKIQPVRNRVAEIYTKVTGSNLIGELMMASGNGTTETGISCEEEPTEDPNPNQSKE